MQDFNIESASPCCCGLTSYQGAKYIAILDLMWATTMILFSGLGILLMIFVPSSFSSVIHPTIDPFTDNSTNFEPISGDYDIYISGASLFVFMILSLLVSSLYAYLAKYLLDSVKARSIKDLNLWFNITLSILLVRLFMYALTALLAGGFVPVSVFGISVIFYTIYSLWVVHHLKKELILYESLDNPYESSFLKQFYAASKI